MKKEIVAGLRKVPAMSKAAVAARSAAASAREIAVRLAVGSRIDRLEAHVAHLEERLLSYHKNRWDAVDKLADYLVGTQIPGDYLEFGVAQGRTFQYAIKALSPIFPEMRFIALDSFEGLPEPKGKDIVDGHYTSGFHAGQFGCSDDAFMANLRSAGAPVDRVQTVKGWFDRSLAPNGPTSEIGKVAAAWIDCDLYESTVPVLNFLQNRLSTGSVLLFDDWRCFRNLPDFGEQLACREWLARNPSIRLHEFVEFGFHGKSFTVEVC